MSGSINFGAEDGSTFIIDKIDLTQPDVITQDILFNNTDTNGTVNNTLTNSLGGSCEFKNSSDVNILKLICSDGAVNLNGAIEGIIDSSAPVGSKGDLVIKATNDADTENAILATISQPLSQFKVNAQVLPAQKETSTSDPNPYTYTLANMLGGNILRSCTDITQDNLISGTDLINGLPMPKNGSFFDLDITNTTLRNIANISKFIAIQPNGNEAKASEFNAFIETSEIKTFRFRIPDISGSIYDIYHLSSHNRFADGVTRSFYNDAGTTVFGFDSFVNLFNTMSIATNSTHTSNTFSNFDVTGVGAQNYGGNVQAEVVLKITAKTNIPNFMTIRLIKGPEIVGGPVTNITEDNPCGCICVSSIVDISHGNVISPEYKLTSSAALTIYRIEFSLYVL